MADSQQIHALDAVPSLTIASWRGYLPAKHSGAFGFFQMKIHGKTTPPEMSLKIIIIFKLKSLNKNRRIFLGFVSTINFRGYVSFKEGGPS